VEQGNRYDCVGLGIDTNVYTQPVIPNHQSTSSGLSLIVDKGPSRLQLGLRFDVLPTTSRLQLLRGPSPCRLSFWLQLFFRRLSLDTSSGLQFLLCALRLHTSCWLEFFLCRLRLGSPSVRLELVRCASVGILAAGAETRGVSVPVGTERWDVVLTRYLLPFL
jgi:hypothetical protein